MFLGSSLNGVSGGIFLVAFNLYILSLGIAPDVLGGILSAGPFAQAVGSIPMGFLMEKIGFKKVFFIIYGVSGLAKILQVATGFVPVIAAAAFISGLALAGDFVVRLPFLAANSDPDQRAQVYSLNAIVYSVSMAAGSLFAGYMPNLIQDWFRTDLAITYRYTLFFAGLLALVAIIPFIMVKDQPPAHLRKISLAPYLWGMDRFTTQQAVVSLFVGISLGLTSPFMNIYYLYHLGATREFFGAMSALVIIPALIADLARPAVRGLGWSRPGGHLPARRDPVLHRYARPDDQPLAGYHWVLGAERPVKYDPTLILRLRHERCQPKGEIRGLGLVERDLLAGERPGSAAGRSVHRQNQLPDAAFYRRRRHSAGRVLQPGLLLPDRSFPQGKGETEPGSRGMNASKCMYYMINYLSLRGAGVLPACVAISRLQL